MADDQILEPNFHYPEGVKGVRYKNPDDYEVWLDPDSSEEYEMDPDDFYGSDLDDSDLGGDEDLPYPPDSLTIIAQDVRTLSGGGQVVDVTIELPDLTDGSQYDLRLTKG